jgi:hypothetical protein
MSNSKRGAGPDASVPDTFKPGNKKTSAEASERRYDPAKQAAGGKGKNSHMFGPQGANQKNPGTTGKIDSRGSGALVAAGGKNKMSGFAGAERAVAGHTSKPTVPGVRRCPHGSARGIVVHRVEEVEQCATSPTKTIRCMATT